MSNMYDRIKQLRISLGMSQDELARALGYKDRSMVTKIEGGKVDISQKKIVAFANALNTTPRYLMDGDESREKELDELLTKWHQLNDDGKEKLIEYADFLISRYGKKDSDFSEEGIAQ